MQSPDIMINDRRHLVALCARMMRFIVIDSARKRFASKRHGKMLTLTTEGGANEKGADVDALALEAALLRLNAIDPERARIVEMRYFGGMTLEDISEVLGISTATVKRSWAVTRVWLKEAMEDDVKQQRS